VIALFSMFESMSDKAFADLQVFLDENWEEIKVKFDSESSLSKEEQLAHPEWVGLSRKVKQMFEDEFYEMEVFV